MSHPGVPHHTVPHGRSHAGDSACALAWCTTAHGATAHSDDEDHRSDGIMLPATARARRSATRATEVEVGLLRRRDDDQSWLVIEDGADVHLEITLDTARALLRAIRDDAQLRAALWPGHH